MTSKSYYQIFVLAIMFLGVVALTLVANADHSWGSYHWARKTNPFTLKLGDNVSNTWDSYLTAASADWNQSQILKTVVVTGSTNPKNCRPKTGQVEVCNSKYGNNGWLGLAQIWVSGSHITKGVAKLNDTYFNLTKYNTPGWRRLVMCQEVAHTFGLDHQDENFTNPNLGSCMDYTNDPDGSLLGQLSNEQPNAHDYEQLETIYAHLDADTTLSFEDNDGGPGGRAGFLIGGDFDSPADWGKVIRQDKNNRPSLYVRDFGRDQKIFTFVFWAN